VNIIINIITSSSSTIAVPQHAEASCTASAAGKLLLEHLHAGTFYLIAAKRLQIHCSRCSYVSAAAAAAAGHDATPMQSPLA
jgi:hypothetical protein